MQITVTFRHMTASDALREYAKKKLSTLDRYFDKVQDVHVVVMAAKKQHTTEVTVHSPGEVFKATAKTDDAYSSVDSVIDKLERHAVKRKEMTKLASHHAKPLGELGEPVVEVVD